MNINLKLFLALISTQFLFSQQNAKPKLIVGIVIDQMRAEYLYRFEENYSENGFKRLMKEGFNVKNAHHNYVSTTTGPGHASIYTGTTPANHGIVANSWYDRKSKSILYCAEGIAVNNIKGNQKNEVSRSPENLLVSTITDELKLHSNHRSKVIGVSLKDRGAIFPAGHLADYAFWYDSDSGDFTTSTYYNNKLPDWLVKFNQRKLADSLLNLVWKPLLPIDKYINSLSDNASNEKLYVGRKSAVFPYDLKKIRKDNGNFDLIYEVPFGNSLLTELVLQTIKGEDLGGDQETDFLCVSYSSTDKVGHSFGIRSKELEDSYVRMDREIAKLITYLDKYIGKQNYLFFLTADHAANDSPGYLKKIKMPGKFYYIDEIREKLNKYLSNKFGTGDYIQLIDKYQIYLNAPKQRKEEILRASIPFLKTLDGIKEVYVPSIVEQNLNNGLIGDYIKSSYNYKNSGDILLHFNSGWMSYKKYGTSHGTAYTSDTQVPLLWYGWNIPKGNTVKTCAITQIAPTISMLVNIPLPSSADRNPILELFD